MPPPTSPGAVGIGTGVWMHVPDPPSYTVPGGRLGVGAKQVRPSRQGMSGRMPHVTSQHGSPTQPPRDDVGVGVAGGVGVVAHVPTQPSSTTPGGTLG